LSVCFRLVGTDIRKQTHKKAKRFVRRNLGKQSPPIMQYTISIDIKTWVSEIWNRYEIKLLGVSMSPCVVLWPLGGRRRPSHTKNSKQFQTFN
jgi:hypothetical protein